MIVPSLSFPLMINLQKQYGVFHKKQLKYIKKPKQSPKILCDFLLIAFVCKQVRGYTNRVFVKHDTYFKPVIPALNVGKH